MKSSNYTTVNQMENAAAVDWCLSAKERKSFKQAEVKLSTGQSYPYGTNFVTAEGDVVIIGKVFPKGHHWYVDYAGTTGVIGVVTEITPKLALPSGGKVVNLDFVFTEKVTEKTVEACSDYLDEVPDPDTLQYGYYSDSNFNGSIYPITFYIRQVLSAASILAHRELASPEAIEKATKCLLSSRRLDLSDMDECTNSWGFEMSPIDFCDIQVDVGDKNLDELDALEIDGLEEGIYERDRDDDDDHDQEKFDRFTDYINKYVNIGAVSIMVRGGFVNLLKAYFSVKPPIGEFFDEMLEAIGEHGHPDALTVLKECEP